MATLAPLLMATSLVALLQTALEVRALATLAPLLPATLVALLQTALEVLALATLAPLLLATQAALLQMALGVRAHCPQVIQVALLAILAPLRAIQDHFQATPQIPEPLATLAHSTNLSAAANTQVRRKDAGVGETAR
jgi:hypothetical protein